MVFLGTILLGEKKKRKHTYKRGKKEGEVLSQGTYIKDPWTKTAGGKGLNVASGG